MHLGTILCVSPVVDFCVFEVELTLPYNLHVHWAGDTSSLKANSKKWFGAKRDHFIDTLSLKTIQDNILL